MLAPSPPLPKRGLYALKARQIVPLLEKVPVIGRNLFTKPLILDNGHIVVQDGRIISLEKSAPADLQIIDLGDVALLPVLVNAHTHLQLSWLAGCTLWHQGFTPWLASMLPQLLPAIGAGFANAERLDALGTACASISGTIVGDVGGSIPGALTAVNEAARTHALSINHFCEWFGYSQTISKIASPWPPRADSEILGNDTIAAQCSPAAHALYSTSGETLQKAHKYCVAHKRVFTFHLAEAPEENQLLLNGTGPLAELYRTNVLPPDWQPPGLRSLALAQKLGILSKCTLAVHGVQLEKKEVDAFAQTGANLCLCPRSNANLAVGNAPVWDYVHTQTPICLGTDGLTSATDLDVRQEAFFLRENLDMPIYALWRMATINGASALGRQHTGLGPGSPVAFSIWPAAN